MRAHLLLLLLASSAALGACVLFGEKGEEEGETTGSTSSAVTSCVAGPRPSSGYVLVPALGDQSFTMPVAMLPSPTDSSRFYVVEKSGYVRLASSSSGAGGTTLFADLHSRVNATANEAGLLGMALHPQFAENGIVFFSYTKTSTTAASGLASVIARGKSFDGGVTLDPSSMSEVLSFDQPYSNHNGGNIAFGKDGMLYAGYGDGGSGGDPQGNGQNKNVLLGKILRLDINNGTPYAIPSTNPFASSSGSAGGRKEIFAWGLRNPWRFSFDRVTGDLWAGDVGQNKYEEVDKVVVGGNYGWGVREGMHCYASSSSSSSSASCSVPSAIDPIVEYDHAQGFSITGGYVYRGTAIPDLIGKYIYGDFGSGKIWSIPSSSSSGGVTPTPTVVLESGLQIPSFAEDNDGELYVLDYGSGKVKKIVLALSSSNGIPQKLSETGCFQSSDPRIPSSKLVPYDVNSPLWSDGADKSRWMAIPANGKIRVGAADGDWELPTGSVLVKEFRVGGKRIETRLFVRHTDGSWAGYTYEWDASESDATLLVDGKSKSIWNGASAQTWTYPSRAQCMGCHNAAAGATLGLETAQLNRSFTYPNGTTTNQLVKLESMGIFSTTAPLPPSTQRPALPSPSNVNASIEDRARSYLHSNCAFCHRPQGPGRGAADWRFTDAFDDTHACNALPETGTLGVFGAKLIVPGDPSSSLVSIRMHLPGDGGDGGGRMPPLGTGLVDSDGAAIVDSFIASLTTCP